MLVAVGLQAERSLAASVAIRWMVKDGLGRIARLLIAMKYSRRFDADIKVKRLFSILCS